MTDEEKLAEEYAEGMAVYYESAHGSIPSQFKKYLKKAYLAGLKARGPIWHRVAEGDLPKEYTEVLQENGVKVILIGGHRYVYGAKWEDDAIVDYWCEIPTYTEG